MMQWFIGVVFVLWAVLTPVSYAVEPVSAPSIGEELGSIEDAITTQEPANALVATGSALFEWRTSPDYPDLAKRIIDTYRTLSPVILGEQFQIRKELLPANNCGFMCFDNGLMAFALDRFEEAADSFMETTSDPAFSENPFPHLMRAKSILQLVPTKLEALRLLSAPAQVLSATDALRPPPPTLQDALKSYQAAINAATHDPAALFRVRYDQTIDLFHRGYVDESIEKLKESLKSDYTLEHAWALEEGLFVVWDLNDKKTLETYWQDLESLLPSLKARPDLPFEVRRYNRINEVAERMRKVRSGDQAMRMVMDEESVELCFLRDQYPKALERLLPWISVYPIEKNASWDKSFREAAISVHLLYYSSLQRLGRFIEAEEGLRRIVESVIDPQTNSYVIQAWGWLGNSLRDQGRAEEARAAYELALLLDIQHTDVTVTRGLPIDFLQRYVLHGVMDGPVRASHVANYECVLNSLSDFNGSDGQ